MRTSHFANISTISSFVFDKSADPVYGFVKLASLYHPSNVQPDLIFVGFDNVNVLSYVFVALDGVVASAVPILYFILYVIGIHFNQ